MGTSSFSGGPTRGSSLLPPWADEIDGDAPTDDVQNDDVPDEQHPNDQPESEPNDSQDSAETPSPQHPPDTNKPTIDYSPVNRQVRNYVSGGSGAGAGRIARSYVQGLGGSSRAAQASAAGRRATAGLAGFARDIVGAGLLQALERLNLGSCIGEPPATALAKVAEAIVQDANNVDDREAARAATRKTLIDLHEKIAEGSGDLTALESMTTENIGDLVHASVENYIYERIMQVVERAFEREQYEASKLVQLEVELRDYIELDVRRALRAIDIVDFDWNSPSSQAMTTSLYANAFEIWEAMHT